jgi:hypothetical protein
MQTKPYPVSIRSECFLPFGAGWVCPTPEEIRTLMQIAELTGKQSSHTHRPERQSNRQALDWGRYTHSFFGWAILVEYAGLGKIWKV